MHVITDYQIADWHLSYLWGWALSGLSIGGQNCYVPVLRNVLILMCMIQNRQTERLVSYCILLSYDKFHVFTVLTNKMIILCSP